MQSIALATDRCSIYPRIRAATHAAAHTVEG